MTPLLALAGVSLVLAGLRMFAAALDDVVVKQLRAQFERISEWTLGAFGAGIVATLLLQASSVTALAAMALVERGALSAEAAVIAVLGAAVGSAAKSWLWAHPFAILGPLLAGIGSLPMLFVRSSGRRRSLQIVLAIGLMYLGWYIAELALADLSADPRLKSVVDWFGVGTLPGLMATIALGFFAAALVQSSTAVVAASLALVSSGVVAPPAAIAIVLGANVGTAMTPLLASLEYAPAARVVAIVNALFRALGVALAGLFFHSLVATSIGISEELSLQPTDSVLVAHTLFAVLNGMLWLSVAPAVTRLFGGRRLQDTRRSLLSGPVRQMLARLPDQAAREIAVEHEGCLRATKIVLDQMLSDLDAAHPKLEAKPARELHGRLQAAEELIAEVVLRGDVVEARLQRSLAELNALGDMLVEVTALVRRMDNETGRVRRLRQRALGALYDDLRGSTEALWRALVAKRPPIGEHDAFARFERGVYVALQQERADPPDFLEIARQVAHLQRIYYLLVDVTELQSIPEEPRPVVAIDEEITQTSDPGLPPVDVAVDTLSPADAVSSAVAPEPFPAEVAK